MCFFFSFNILKASLIHKWKFHVVLWLSLRIGYIKWRKKKTKPFTAHLIFYTGKPCPCHSSHLLLCKQYRENRNCIQVCFSMGVATFRYGIWGAIFACSWVMGSWKNMKNTRSHKLIITPKTWAETDKKGNYNSTVEVIIEIMCFFNINFNQKTENWWKLMFVFVMVNIVLMQYY